MRPPSAPVVRYGDHPDQVANLHLPADEPRSAPCVVLVHGGFWRERWDRTLMTPLAADLARRGLACWNLEYRRVGQDGGGWPGTFEDVAAGIDALRRVDGVDDGRVVVVGHSAGGHLALWSAARRRLPRGAPGAKPGVVPRAVVALAGVCDLAAGSRERLGDGAVDALMGGGPDDLPNRYAVASPAALLPIGVPQLLVHGSRDEHVPPSQSREHLAAAQAAGDEAGLLEPDADHFDVVDAEHDAWRSVAARLTDLLL
jgi:acetyl esterase/lipase